MLFSRVLPILALASAVTAQIKGFNYGSTNPDGSFTSESQFQQLFSTAQGLVGAPGFTSARLYTMIAGGTVNNATGAIPAAINTKTSLLLGLWGSGGQAAFSNELAALSSAITQYGAAFADLVVGISVGSEDLYRISPTGIENKSGAGAEPSTLVDYIGQLRSAIANTILSGKPVGHVDTWTAWVNASNDAVISACDFLGQDAYPYFQNTEANSIQNAQSEWTDALQATIANAQGKPVWVTETGWPLSGPTSGQAVPSVANAKTYWDEVGCSLFGKTNTWWYTLYDGSSSPSFGIVGSTLSTTPQFDLSCSSSGDSTTTSSAGSQSQQSQSQQTQTQQSQTQKQQSQTQESLTQQTQTQQSQSQATETQQSQSLTTQTSQATSLVTVTVTKSSASQSESMSVASTQSGNQPAQSPSSQSQPAPTTSQSAPPAYGSSCPASLTGEWQFPHLIVPVDSSQPSKAFGTSYFGSFNSTVSSVFNFDIPPSYAGLTCTLVFLFPTQQELETSGFTISGNGGLGVSQLSTPATQSTSYSSLSAGVNIGGIPCVAPSNSYVVAGQPCAAGETVSFEFAATGTLDLTYFQDYNPSPIGVYISAC